MADNYETALLEEQNGLLRRLVYGNKPPLNLKDLTPEQLQEATYHKVQMHSLEEIFDAHVPDGMTWQQWFEKEFAKEPKPKQIDVMAIAKNSE